MAQLLQNALCGTALILAAALLRRVLKGRLAPEARLCLWGLCLFRLLTPAFPRSALSLWGLLPRTGTAAPAAPVINAAPAPSLGVGNAPDPTAPVWTFTPAPVEPPAVFPWKTVLLAVWLGVGVALTIRYALSWNRTRREVACAIPLGRDDPRYAPLPPFARLREGPMEGAPLTFGVVKPTVVLSPGLSGEALECVLAHEGVHARRRDNLWHYAMALALVVHWWNPAVWLMARLLRRDIELSCDRAALKKLGADRRGDYARALVSLATPSGGPAFCQTFGRKAAEERIISIMKFKKTTILGAVLSLALVVGATVAFASEPKEPECDSAKVNLSVELGDKTPQNAAPVPSAGVDAQSDFHKVNPDDVNLSLMKEHLAQKVADGDITQEEADQRLAAAEEMLEGARRGEVELFLAEDGWFYGSNAGLMYYKDESGKLIPIDPDTAVSGYVLNNYDVKLPNAGKNIGQPSEPVETQAEIENQSILDATHDKIFKQMSELTLRIMDKELSGKPAALPEPSDCPHLHAIHAGRLVTFTPKSETIHAKNDLNCNWCVDCEELVVTSWVRTEESHSGADCCGDPHSVTPEPEVNSTGPAGAENGVYNPCADQSCGVPYDHCHIDGDVVRIYYENPGLLCAHPDCDNDAPHQHDGTQYAGKAGKYVILNPELEPVPSAAP